MNPIVSIIIPHWNHREVLVECLDSLARTTWAPVEIIVVDNNSSDDSVEFIRTNFPDVRLVENRKNRGFAGGCNDGARVATGEYLVILNNDTTQEPDWLNRLVDFMETHPKVGIAQPKLINATDRSRFDYSGASGGFMDRYAFPFARGRIFESGENDNGQYNDSVQIFWASGTACILRREVYEQVGLFDEHFFAHMEEIDFDWRAQLAGWNIAVVPDAVVYHHSGYTLPPESPFKKYLNQRNSIFMLLSNYRLPRAVFRGIERFLLDIMAFGFTLWSKDWARAKGIMKAWLWIWSHPGVIKRKRKQVKQIRRRSDLEMDERLYSASIALEYHILRRKNWDKDRHSIGAGELNYSK